MSEEQNLVTIDLQDGVADVRLNRPQKYNALSPGVFKAIIEAESSLQTALIGSPNQVEAVCANFEKRAPKFNDPA